MGKKIKPHKEKEKRKHLNIGFQRKDISHWFARILNGALPLHTMECGSRPEKELNYNRRDEERITAFHNLISFDKLNMSPSSSQIMEV